MPKITKESLTAIAGLSDADKADLFALFDSATETEKQLAALRANVPTDSQTVVDKVEFSKLQETAAKSEEQKKQLAEALEKLQVKTSGLDPLEAFKPFLSFLG